MTLGENIRITRKEQKLTQKQLGKRCGIDEANIRKYELGSAIPKMETVQKIATALGVDPFSLYSFDMASEALEKGMNQKESKLLDNYRQLNTSGQQKADNYIEDLTKIPEYQKEPPRQ